jgi:hypothetical protein
MAFAGFPQFAAAAASYSVSAACEASPGKSAVFLFVCLSHLQQLIPCSYWTLAWIAALSLIAA